MRVLLVFGFLVAVLTTPLMAQSDAQKAPITRVIDAQVEAFLAKDLPRAFSFASPNIQRIFGSPERFGMMVQQGYPMVWRPAQVEFLELRDVAGALWQRVLIRDTAGQAHLLDYQMIETETGWKINAVQLLKAPDASV